MAKLPRRRARALRRSCTLPPRVTRALGAGARDGASSTAIQARQHNARRSLRPGERRGTGPRLRNRPLRRRDEAARTKMTHDGGGRGTRRTCAPEQAIGAAGRSRGRLLLARVVMLYQWRSAAAVQRDRVAALLVAPRRRNQCRDRSVPGGGAERARGAIMMMLVEVRRAAGSAAGRGHARSGDRRVGAGAVGGRTCGLAPTGDRAVWRRRSSKDGRAR